MSVVIDTGLFYAVQNERATNHDTAKRALSHVFSGEFGQPYATDFVYDETVTLVRSRTNSFREATHAGNRILGRADYPDVVEFVTVSKTLFKESIEIFERYRDHALSFTDASTIALVKNRDIDFVLAFDDDDFDGVVSRLAPAEIAA
ncbi:type II toxin-antitoxin system VapC family toxin [Halorussus amylolyticus]|uniref:type II toxin-antitoxin system VapC family toxin n=1 Tax=Halorussus amylolyticus TaxID=1126242 RepID=UPI00104F7736|nr:PIN domain-containing protein [Halorussus amylolyticus]